jgi:hypothetical protein
LFHFRTLPALLFALSLAANAAPRVQSAPVPPEMRSTAFTLTVNGTPIDVAHAAASYDYASFDLTRPVTVEITAADPHFWDRGVDIQPWRLGLRATRAGATIRFPLAAPAKLAISRPRDFLNHAQMLFLFASAPPPPQPRAPSIHAFAPGVYHHSLNPKSGETLYLAPGSYFYGSLNLWKVDNVKILGRGTIVYDGPQDPASDEGWMQKPDWHCIDALDAHHVEVDGVTCVIRSRTWSVQLKDSTHITFDDLRVMGGNPGNANQDGIDWIGSSDGLVRNSFFRASDDVIALMGNWDGYNEADMLRPGRDVQNITIENSVLSTSISNIVRAGWPQKIFNSRNFTLRDSDILHAGIGACGQTFGLLGFWGAKGSQGDHGHYTFENLFLDDWYSLVQMEQDAPGLHDFTFRNIWALDQPPLAGSLLSGQVSGVVFDNVKYGQHVAATNADLPLTTDRAQPPRFEVTPGPIAAFTWNPPVFAPGQTVTFTARTTPHTQSAHTQFLWYFGDGTRAHGRTVRHRFPDASGTQLDATNGAGRFRILLHAHDTRPQKTGERRVTAAEGLSGGSRGTAAEGLTGGSRGITAENSSGRGSGTTPESLSGGSRGLQAPENPPTDGAFRPGPLPSSNQPNQDDWAAQGIVAVAQWHEPPPTPGPTLPGLTFQIYPGAWTELPNLAAETPVFSGNAPDLNASAQGFTHYAVAWDGYLDIPADGGYTFHLLDRDGARLLLDGIEVAKTGPPFPQVCGAPGNAMRYDRGSLGLRAGRHTLHFEGLHSASQGPPRLLWEGPSLPLTDVPAAAFSRPRQDALHLAE